MIIGIGDWLDRNAFAAYVWHDNRVCYLNVLALDLAIVLFHYLFVVFLFYYLTFFLLFVPFGGVNTACIQEVIHLGLSNRLNWPFTLVVVVPNILFLITAHIFHYERRGRVSENSDFFNGLNRRDFTASWRQSLDQKGCISALQEAVLRKCKTSASSFSRCFCKRFLFYVFTSELENSMFVSILTQKDHD